MEFRKLYQTFEPSQRVQQDRKRVQENMQFIVDRAYRGHVKIHVELFGSSINNLGFSTSDVDICLRIPQSHGLDEDEFARLTNMFRLANILRRFGMQDVRPVASARVPICKFVHPETGLQCDANFGNELGVKNSLLLRTYTLIDPRVRPLVMLVKNWAKNRDLNDAADGGTITSYAYSLMVLNFLQIRGIIPSLQEL
ncbi:uncharacterized protein EV422DRAFT_493059, partial [Fimicolochytrium jonesii]|uniref:uncharacterized protein n=1 Tax=Fimicolochytrium jonesii TaxID=1396493 RepID=UPI0022FE83D1